jgi:hypothetical protein
MELITNLSDKSYQKFFNMPKPDSIDIDSGGLYLFEITLSIDPLSDNNIFVLADNEAGAIEKLRKLGFTEEDTTSDYDISPYADCFSCVKTYLTIERADAIVEMLGGILICEYAKVWIKNTLLMAAPDLLEALQLISDDINSGEPPSIEFLGHIRLIADSAIKKATEQYGKD